MTPVFLWSTGTLAGVGPARAALTSGAQEELHPATWLNWLSSVHVAGKPLISSQAALAFAWSLVAMVVLIGVAVVGTRRLSLKPRGLQTVLEMMVGGLRGLVVSVMGPRGVDFVPFIGTLFIYIAAMNLLGLVPGSLAPTSSLSITAALAIIVFVVVQLYGFKERGVGYFEHFTEGVPKGLVYVPLAALVFLIHLVGEFFRPVTLALRLFGNIMAGETVIFVLLGLAAGALVKLRVPLPFQLPNMALEVLISVVQATVFSLLTAVYLAGVVREPEPEAH